VIVRIITYEKEHPMNSEKYIGLDVHQATIVVAVTDSTGRLAMESILETEAATILQFFAGLRGTLSVTFEEGTWSVWLYDLLNPHVDKLVVCNPRKNALLKDGNKSDRIDARKLAELLRGNQLKPVYHGETGVRMLRELSRSYLTIVKDLSRVMNRLKAVYRSWAIPCAGRDVYYRRPILKSGPLRFRVGAECKFTMNDEIAVGTIIADRPSGSREGVASNRDPTPIK
jgi:transposase